MAGMSSLLVSESHTRRAAGHIPSNVLYSSRITCIREAFPFHRYPIVPISSLTMLSLGFRASKENCVELVLFYAIVFNSLSDRIAFS